MRIVTRLTAAAIPAIAASVMLGVPLSADASVMRPLEPGVYTAKELREAGRSDLMDDIPATTGLPACPISATTDEIALTQEDPPADIHDAPECAMRPEDAVYGVGLSAPHPSYHHNGHQSTGIGWSPVDWDRR